MAVFTTDDGNGNVRLYGATAADDGQGNVTLLVTEAEEGEVIAEDEVSLSSLAFVDDEVAEAEERAKEHADAVDSKYSEKWSQVDQLADSISQLVVSTDADGTEVSMMEQTETGWKFSMASILESIKANEEANASLDEKYADEVKRLQEQLENFGSYVTIAAADGAPYIELGNSGAFKVRITNEKMAFLHVQDGAEKELTTIDTETMNIASATIGDELKVGGLRIAKRGNNNVGFTWKED